MIYAIGDSHSIFFHNSIIIKEHWLGMSNLPVTMFQLIKKGLDIYNIGNLLGNGHENYNIEKNDHVIFYYGWNDIQKNINKYSNGNYYNEINSLLSLYIHVIKAYRIDYQIIPIISCIYPNARISVDKCSGSNELRANQTEYMNATLKKMCMNENLLYLDIYDIIVDEYKLLNNKYTKDNIHLDYDNLLLIKIIEDIVCHLISPAN